MLANKASFASKCIPVGDSLLRDNDTPREATKPKRIYAQLFGPRQFFIKDVIA